jgi:hypothetical protein
MPRIYASPRWSRQAPSRHTFYQLFVGPGAAFEVGRERTFQEIVAADGLADTAFGAWADDSVPWTKPQDLAFGPNLPMPALGSHGTIIPFPIYRSLIAPRHVSEGSWNLMVFFGDGSVRTHHHRNEKLEGLRAYITWSGGEVLDPDFWY